MIASAAGSIADTTSDKEGQQFMQALLTAPRIYVAGAGRSGLIAKAFAMRLMHIGMESYVVGETITPAMQNGDLLVVFPGLVRHIPSPTSVRPPRQWGGHSHIDHVTQGIFHGSDSRPDGGSRQPPV